MAPSVRLAPRSALHRLPVPDALVRFLAEQGLDCATLRGSCADPELGERLARLGLEPGDDLRIVEPPAAGAAAEDPWDLQPGARLVTVSHRLRVRSGGPVAAVEAWLVERHGCAPAGEDGGALQRVCEPSGSSSLTLRGARLETLEQALTLEDYLRRRTTIAQWVPRAGRGARDENADHLLSIARRLSGGDEERAQEAVRDHRRHVRREEQLINEAAALPPARRPAP